IWAINLHPKIEIFLWRAIRNRIPVNVALEIRQILIDDVCPLCSSPPELVEHALLLYSA
ncbi:conserved hypothetical protein, partial [Ricinus communis]